MVAALNRITPTPDLKVPPAAVEAAKPDLKVPPAAIEAAKPVNTAELVRAAQQELARIGCFAGTANGDLNDVTKGAIKRYRLERGQPAGKIEVTDGFVSELKDRSKRVCPLVCSAGQIAEGERCVAVKKPTPVARQKDEEEYEKPRRPQRERAKQEEEYERPRRPSSGRGRQEFEAAAGCAASAAAGPPGSSVAAVLVAWWRWRWWRRRRLVAAP